MGASIGTSGLTQAQIQQAFEDAINNTSGGGGGGGVTFQDLTVVGTTNFTIPAGFNAKVAASVNQGGTISVNGAVILHSVNTSYNNMVVNISPLAVRPVPGQSFPSNSLAVSNGGAAITNGNMFANQSAFTRGQNSQIFDLLEGDMITGTGTFGYVIGLFVI